MTAVLNHLWQSTVFAAVAALLAIALRRNHARTRYWIWVAASLKFLIPFSLLVSIGNRVEWRSAPAIEAQPVVAVMMDEISQPFAPIVSSAAGASAPRSVMPSVLMAIWIAGCAIVLISWFGRWRRVRMTLRRASPVQIEFPIKVMSSPALIEPGIFGIFRPVLLLPEGIADRMTPAQFQSILAHELCHVRRRDNLAAAIHMLVEAIFWFHPLVWWIGARLIEERERACDEEVVRSGSEPGVYAESILQVCKFYLESPLECAAGVTGSDLKKRIESIMSGRFGRGLTPARKLLLAAASFGAIAGPLIFGALTAPRIRAQSQDRGTAKTDQEFEVASVKPRGPAVIGPGFRSSTGSPPGMLNYSNVTLKTCIQRAYGVRAYQISGGPGWLGDERFDIMAKAASIVPEDQMMAMLRKLLEHRFKLAIHREAKEMPVYALVVGKNGPKIQAVKDDDGGTQVDGGDGHQISARNLSMEGLAQILSRRQQTDRPVLDRTGLKGVFNFTLDFATDDAASADSTAAPSIFTAVQEQLGLKLEATKGPVEIVVIDHVEKPSDNFEPPILDKPAQPPSGAPSREAFDVATIKLNKTGGYGGFPGLEPGGQRFTAKGLPLLALIMLAYNVTPDQISGVPNFFNTEAYDIEASCDHPIKQEQALRMLQTLLADRFRLTLHRETRERPMYALVVGKGGPKLRESAEVLSKPDMQRTAGGISYKSAPMSAVVLELSQQLNGLVVDQTGLKGRYDFSLEYARERAGRGVLEGREPARGSDGLPSIFTAVQEQLGLKLEAATGPVEILVIDHAEKPTEN